MGATATTLHHSHGGWKQHRYAQQPLMALFDPSAAFRNVIFLVYLCEVLYGQPDATQLVCRSEQRVCVCGAVGAGVHAHVFDCIFALLGSALLRTCFAGLGWLH